MHVIGKIAGLSETDTGEIILNINVINKDVVLENYSKYNGFVLDVEIDKQRHARSNDANRYLWSLIDEMSKALLVEKWDVYLLELSRWGVFVDLTVANEALQKTREIFRYSEILEENNEYITLRGFYGSSTYNSLEFSRFLNGVIEDANGLNVQTLSTTEIEKMLSAYEEIKKCY